MRNYEEMSDHELLMELVKEKRRNDRNRYVRYAVYGVICLFLIYLGFTYVPRIMKIVNQYNELMSKYGDLLAKLESTDTKINDFMESLQTDVFDKMKDIADRITALLGRFGF